jgi:hypothetical protein
MLNKIDKVGIVNGAELQVAKELVIENNPAYKEIFDNIASKLDCNLRYREFMDYYNGNLMLLHKNGLIKKNGDIIRR